VLRVLEHALERGGASVCCVVVRVHAGGVLWWSDVDPRRQWSVESGGGTGNLVSRSETLSVFSLQSCVQCFVVAYSLFPY
jgi:hypothetical protein